jgi:hypothetical protein
LGQDALEAFSNCVEALRRRFGLLCGCSLVLIDDGAGCILRSMDHCGGQWLSFVRYR